MANIDDLFEDDYEEDYEGGLEVDPATQSTLAFGMNAAVVTVADQPTLMDHILASVDELDIQLDASRLNALSGDKYLAKNEPLAAGMYVRLTDRLDKKGQES